jgi:uncharacterized protein (DUF362 family)
MAETTSRRSFLVRGALTAASAAAGLSLLRCLPDVDGVWKEEGQALCSTSASSPTPGNSADVGRVLEAFDPALSVGPKANPEVAAANLKKLLLALTGQVDLRAAWGALIPALAANQVVGIKVNTLNSQVPTRPELVKAMVDSLKEGLSLRPDQILVWDRRLDELTKAGLTADFLGATVEGTRDTVQDKGQGRDYELKPICLGGRKARLSNIITRRVDHLINMAVIKRHDASGFTGCLKNHYGTIDNPGEFHDQLGPGQTVLERRFAKAIPELNALTEVVSKTRLCVVDAIFGVAKGNTESPVDCVPNRLLLGLDPVALDARARQIRDQERGDLGPDPETVSSGWLEAAERMGLGSSTPKVEIVK